MIRLLVLVLVQLLLVFVLLFSNVNSIKGRCEDEFFRVGNVAVDLGVVTLPPSCDFSSDEASEDENDNDRANMPPTPSVVIMLVGEYNFGARLVLCCIMV